MNYTIKDVSLSEQEFYELWCTLGEFRRICYDQVYRYVKGDYVKNDDVVTNERLEIAESLIYKLITDVKNKNIYTK